MTHQKSYNKFVATAAAATLVATAVVPAAFASEVKTAAFTDVSPKYKAAVDFVVAQDIAQGVSDTQFGISQEIIRGDAAIMIASAADLNDASAKASGFTDVPARGALAINSLKAAGVTNGKSATSFDFNGKITRGEAAVFLANAFELKGDTSKVKFTDVNARYMAAVAALVEAGVTNGKSTTSFGTDDNITRGEFAQWIFALEAMIVGEEVAEVASVTALNGLEVQVKFKVALDKASAEDLANYDLGGVFFTNAELSEDGMTVTLTADQAIDVSNEVFEILPIETKANADVSTSKFVSLFSYTDNVAPTVVSIKAEGTEAVVTFNEELANEGTVSLDGTEIFDTPRNSAPFYEVSGKELIVYNLTTEQSYKLDIVGAEDAAANMSGQITSNFTVAKPVVDDVKPTVSSSVTGNKLTLSFSEKVTKGSVEINGEFVNSEDVVASEDQKTFTVDVQDAGFFNGKTFINGQIVVTDFEDMTGNTMNEAKFNATFTADRTAPKFVSASIYSAPEGNNDKVLVTFDDVVERGSLSSLDELVITSIDGIFQSNEALDLTDEPGFENVEYGYDLDKNGKKEGNEWNIFAIDYDTVDKSTYSFELDGRVVEDVYGNRVTETISFSATAPEYKAAPGEDTKDVRFASVAPQSNNKDINVVFNFPMSNSAVSASNYTLAGKALPAGTTLKFVNNRENVVITLPQGSVTANGNYALAATKLTDVDGNTLENGKTSATVFLKENVVPTATKITVVDSQNFTVDFSEAIVDGLADDATVIVKINGVTVSPFDFNYANGDLQVETENNFSMTDSISVEFKNSDLADVNGNKVKNGVVSK